MVIKLTVSDNVLVSSFTNFEKYSGHVKKSLHYNENNRNSLKFNATERDHFEKFLM